ncbi:MAG TPA: L-serine ammonia-lyase, iron-sulfur-dependent, subunit alpha [Lachnospiraceae bacterium]|nr:L-serine ammonia-lyase, iron-sulfur-dependent, subunit alpha [Lachnospiraceae bacterium]
MSFDSLTEIVERCDQRNLPFWQVIMDDDCEERNVNREESGEQMSRMWEAMLHASDAYQTKDHSYSGLSGGDGGKMEQYLKKGHSICDPFMGEVIMEALKMGESNACMKRIVAAPTAGACGVLPAVLVPWFYHEKGTKKEMIQALYVSAGIGQVIAARASISGARGGCQAEIGSASAMAAGALVALSKGTPEQIIHAAAIALKGLLGLVCDPVAGLVEVPCIKRGVIGAVNAMSSADMALAGITSRIPPDQVIDAMQEIGDKMDASLKETALGGLAATSAGMEARVKFEEMMQNE